MIKRIIRVIFLSQLLSLNVYAVGCFVLDTLQVDGNIKQIEIKSNSVCYDVLGLDKGQKNVCDCAKEASSFFGPSENPQQTKSRLRKRTAQYLIDQAKVNLMEYLGNIDYLATAYPEAIGSSGGACTLNKLVESTQKCGSEAIKQAKEIRKQFQIEYAFRQKPITPEPKDLFFSRTNPEFQTDADLREMSNSCGISEADVLRMKVESDRSTFKKLQAILKSAQKENIQMSTWDDLMDYMDFSYSGKEKFIVFERLKKVPAFTDKLKDFTNITQVSVDDLKSLDRDIVDKMNERCQDTLKNLSKFLCISDKEVEDYIPKSFNDLKKLSKTLIPTESKNEAIVTASNSNNELKLLCEQGLESQNNSPLPRKTIEYLTALDDLKLNSPFNSLTGSELADSSSFQDRATAYTKENVLAAKEQYCTSIEQEKAKLANSSKEEYIKSCKENPSVECEDTLIFMDLFPEIADAFQNAKNPEGEINFSAEKEYSETPNLVRNFLGEAETPQLAESNVTNTNNPNVGKSRTSASTTASSPASLETASLNNSGRKNQAAAAQNNTRNIASPTSVVGSTYRAPSVSQSQISRNNEIIDDYIDNLVNPKDSNGNPLSSRETIDRIARTIPKKQKTNTVDPVRVADVNRPLLDDVNGSDFPEFAQDDSRDTGEGEGQFKQQDEVDKALEDIYKAKIGQGGAGSRGPASAGGGGASGGAGGGSPISQGGTLARGSASGQGAAENVFTFDGNINDILAKIEAGDLELNDQILNFIKYITEGKNFAIQSIDPNTNEPFLVKVDYSNGLKVKSEGNDLIADPNDIKLKLAKIRQYYRTRLKETVSPSLYARFSDGFGEG